jgi:hypothetical protein
MNKIVIASALAALLVGCGKKDKDDKGSSAGKAKGGDKAAKDLPPLEAEPAVGDITPADKAPFEAVKFRLNGKRNDKGWPLYEAYNLHTKPITYMALHLYAYDKDGKKVAWTETPMSWNGNIPSGTKGDWDVDAATFQDPLPATAVAFDMCFSAIKFEGDEDATNDFDRCKADKPKDK